MNILFKWLANSYLGWSYYFLFKRGREEKSIPFTWSYFGVFFISAAHIHIVFVAISFLFPGDPTDMIPFLTSRQISNSITFLGFVVSSILSKNRSIIYLSRIYYLNYEHKKTKAKWRFAIGALISLIAFLIVEMINRRTDL
jgi:hypothetical protein